MKLYEEKIKYYFIPDDTKLDHNSNCRKCLELFNCKMADKFTLLGIGTGKYYRVISRSYEAEDYQEAFLAKHFSVNTESQNNLTLMEESCQEIADEEIKCPYCEGNRRYFVKNISAVEISQEEYLREKYHLQ